MDNEVNQAVVGDVAKLIVHRLIARKIRHDPGLIEAAKIVHARQADQFAGWPFVREWHELLALPRPNLIRKLISRDPEMVRLRNSSPFYLAEGARIGDYHTKIRILCAARRVVERGLATQNRRNLLMSARVISDRTIVGGEPIAGSALGDDFVMEFKKVRGKVDSNLELGF